MLGAAIDKVLLRRLPWIVAGFYVAIVFLLFLLAIMTHDELGFSFIPVLYATRPLSLFLEGHMDNTFVAIAAGSATNAGVLYALTKVVSLNASKGAK